MTLPDERSKRIDMVVAWARDRPLGPLWDELRRRMGASERRVSTVVVELDISGRQALTKLLKLERVVAPRQRVSVKTLTHELGLVDDELREVAAALAGPIDNRAQARRAATEARAALWADAEARLGGSVPLTLARIRSAGVPGDDVAEHGEMLVRLATVLEALPLRPPKPLPILAWEHMGDPHALDYETTLGRWLRMAVVERVQGDARSESDTLFRRAAFGEGVLVDRLSTPTLTWALRSETDTPAGRLLEGAAADGVPVHLSGALLDRGVPRLKEPIVLCVENPSVIDWLHLTGQLVPTVCTSGWPSTDAQRFLEDLRERDVKVAYAGDFDASGLAIAAFMRERFGAEVWMTDGDYLVAGRGARRWEGDVPQTAWCDSLKGVIERTREVRYQEDPALIGRLVERVLALLP